MLVVADLNLSIRILIGQIVAIDVKIIFVFFLAKRPLLVNLTAGCARRGASGALYPKSA
jgi:hypothetical protein